MTHSTKVRPKNIWDQKLTVIQETKQKRRLLNHERYQKMWDKHEELMRDRKWKVEKMKANHSTRHSN